MLQIKLQSGLCRTHFPLLLLILFFLYHGLQTQNPDASYFSPSRRIWLFGKLWKLLCGWFKTSLWACHVVRAVWVALNFWTPFSFDSPFIPAEAGNWVCLAKGIPQSCCVETGLGHFFCSCEVLWLSSLDDAVRRKSLQIAVSLTSLWATSYSVSECLSHENSCSVMCY